MTINKHYRDVKRALKKDIISNEFNLGKYGFSPYAACGHGCLYCDGRAERYYIEGEFDRDIVIRRNIPDLLPGELAALREPGFISIGSGVSDAYQPVEESEELMKLCSGQIALTNYPVTLLTKSSIIMRDIDSWRRVHERSRFLLMVSLTFTDDVLRSRFEPGASTVDERLKTIESFKKAGMHVGVLAMPFIPFISDTDENIRTLFEKLKSLNVDFIMPGGLTLRPGKQKDLFVDYIRREYPGYLNGIEEIYKENRASGNSIYNYRHRFTKKVHSILDEFEIPAAIPHYVYKGVVPLYDEVYILLRHMQYLYSVRGVDTRGLDSSTGKYHEWLLAEKREFNRKRKSDWKNIEDKLKDLISSGKITGITGNEKLTRFLKSAVLEVGTFDGFKLKLV